ncbi:MAG TPA: phosphatase PAP2 family protein [Gaiellaceae bacterium]|nr:phosphatase PAP2 family protein [Gaiellaceae bacterium]
MRGRARRLVDAAGPELLGGLAVLFAGAWLFAVVAEEVVEGNTHADTRLADWLHDHAQPWLTEIFEAITVLGNFATLLAVVAVAAVLLLRRGERAEAALVVLAFAGAQVITFGLKLGFQRERPFFPDPLATETSYSFPSGHSVVSAAVYGAIGLILARHLSTRRAQLAALAGAALLILLIGFSRLYLGVHYLTDVVAGIALGLAWLALCVVALHLRLRLRQTSRYRASA